MKLMLKFFALNLLIMGITLANIINVPGDQPTIQAGIDAASSGDTILVHPGTYNENLNISSKDITLASLYFTTTDTSHIQQTIVDGNQSNSVLSFSYSNIKVYGLTFQNGYSSDYGGGIKSGWDNCSIELYHCVIRNNTAGNEGGGIWVWGANAALNVQHCEIYGNIAENNGGGVFANAGSYVNIEHSKIYDNSATVKDGGGICAWHTDPIIYDCNIYNNNALRYGGGIRISDSEAYIRNSRLESNVAGCQGGAIAPINSNLFVNNCLFISNTATDECGWASGGAISFYESDTISITKLLEIKSSSFLNNSSVNTSGGLNVGKSSGSSDSVHIEVVIDSCIFSGNHADSRGAIRIQGSNTFFNISHSEFVTNEVARHTSSVGVYNGVVSEIINCLFANNVSSLNDTLDGQNGAVGMYNAEVDFINCTFANNTSDYAADIMISGGGIANVTNSIIWSDADSAIYVRSYDGVAGELYIDYCDIMNDISSTFADSISVLLWGDNNISSDPLFCYPDSNNYHLAQNSPCIGTGDNWENIGAFGIGCGPLSNSDENPTISNEFSLHHNYPNPFNPSTTISYQVPELSFVNLSIFNINGQLVSILVNDRVQPGNYSVKWDAKDFSSGIYFYKMVAGKYSETGKAILLK